MNRHSPQSQVTLIVAGVVAVVGAGLVFVLVAGLLDGVRGIGPVLLGGLAAGVFALAARLVLVARSLKNPSTPSTPSTPLTTVRRARPRPRPRG